MITFKKNLFLCSFTGESGLDMLIANPVTTGSVIFDPGSCDDPAKIKFLFEQYRCCSWAERGIRLFLDSPEPLEYLFEEPGAFLPDFIIVASLSKKIDQLRNKAGFFAEKVFLETYSPEDVERAVSAGFDGIVLRGNEAGGICGAESNFTLLRKIRDRVDLPVWVIGGMGPESSTAALIGGAERIILSDSLLLMGRTDLFMPHEKAVLANTPVTKTIGPCHWVQYRQAKQQESELNQEWKKILQEYSSSDAQEKAWLRALRAACGNSVSGLPSIGEEALWAGAYSESYSSLSMMLDDLVSRVNNNLKALTTSYPLRKGNAFCRDTGIEYPVFQGPMAHVSDRPEFLQAVAGNGAMPFAAMALHDVSRLEGILEETTKLLDGRPWGAGIIGFIPQEMLEPQIRLLEKYRPSAVVIAGGKPGQYMRFAQMGIPAYIHVPSPALIQDYFKAGVRHFIFEGRGSGGHVGPVNSFPLWQAAVSEFSRMAQRDEEGPEGVHVILAGGISDSLSAAMAASFMHELEELGIRTGIIMGTAYLACDEAVSTGAIVEKFRDITLACNRTLVLESGDGHAIRCAESDYPTRFHRKKGELLKRGLDASEVRRLLDQDNIGRLRIATRGITREEQGNGFMSLPVEQQQRDGCYMMGETAGLINSAITMRKLHDSVTTLPEHMRRPATARVRLKMHEEPGAHASHKDIAIIGMACLVPGAHDLDTLWHNILAEMNLVRPVPESRWKKDVNFDPDPETRDRIYSCHGAFLDDVLIDSATYGIPPTTVPSIEPTQFLALEAVSRALSDAGLDRREFDRENTSVFFGTSGGGGDLALGYSVRAALNEYLARSPRIPDDTREKIMEALAGVLPRWTEDSFPGILSNVVAGRITNRFDLKGLNFTVDAACASSLAAVRVACQELAYGGTNIAIAGGIDTTQHTFGYTCFSKTRALSKRAESSPFQEDSDGIILGEGVGVAVFKRLSDALKDNDRIYAVIKGIGGSSDGKGRSMTAPTPQGQVLAMERAYTIAGYSPSTVSLIEAHGTGTSLGDHTELESVQKFLHASGAESGGCAVGSIKSAIGHTKAAAGINGLIKACLAIHNRILPATLNVTRVSSSAVPPGSCIYVNTENRPWISGKGPRRAGVNSFGFGGTNFHVALEESPAPSPARQKIPSGYWPCELFCLAGKDTAELISSVERLQTLSEKSNLPFSLFSLKHFEDQQRRGTDTGRVRLAVAATDFDELRERLKTVRDHILQEKTHRLPPGIWFHAQEAGTSVPGTALLFSGQGSQQRNMGMEFAMFFPAYRQALNQAEHILSGISGIPFIKELFPPPGTANEPLINTDIVQPLLAASEVALYRLLTQFGITPDFCAGHSFGELTALWAAGAMSYRTLLKLSVKRGSIMASAGRNVSGMTAIRCPEEDIAALLREDRDVYPANFNSPVQTVVSGRISHLEEFEKECSAQDIRYKRLQVSHGFHSPFMAGPACLWKELLAEEKFFRPRIPVYSNVNGMPYTDEAGAVAATLAVHLESPVKFIQQITGMHRDNARTFIEIGPGRVLTGLTDNILIDLPHTAVSLMSTGKESMRQFMHSLAAIWSLGHNVDFTLLYRARSLPEPLPEIKPSPTLFRVNGGAVVSTVVSKHGEDSDLNAQPLRFMDEKPSDSPPEEQPVSAAMEIPANVSAISSNRLEMISMFQENMELLLEQQEKQQKKRREMYERMWKMHETIMHSLVQTGFAPSVRAEHAETVHAAPISVPVPEPAQTELHEDVRQELPREQKESPVSREVHGEVDVTVLLYGVISERTGYPSDMLAPEQHLEADLGIDSIKRVEILTALKDEHPSLSDIASEKYFEEAAQLKTIGDISAWIIDTFMKQGTIPEATADKVISPATVPAAESVPEADVPALLYGVISERTGYPSDMLAPEQHLEADLGIDSIKRVEILTALKDEHPSLSDIASEKYFEEAAQLKTIGDISAWIIDTFMKQGTIPEAAADKVISPATVPAAESVPEADVPALLYGVISERTGYPSDMLAPEQHLEADLGIDSIKRVEILTALKDEHPSLSDIASEKYFEEAAQLKTIGDISAWIIDTFMKQGGGNAEQAVPAEEAEGAVYHDADMQDEAGSGPVVDQPQTEANTDSPAPITRHLLELADAPYTIGNTIKKFPGSVVILSGSHKAGNSLHAKLESDGIRSLLIRDKNDRESAAASYSVSFSSEEEIQALASCIMQEHGPVAGVINMLALHEQDQGSNEAAVHGSFMFAKAMGPELKKADDPFWFSVTAMGGDFGMKGSLDFDPVQNGCHGITKTISHEWQGVRTRCIDLHPGNSLDRLTRSLCYELYSVDDLPEVCWNGNRRRRLRLRPASLSDMGKLSIPGKPVFLLTGGGRGITALAAMRLASLYNPVLILTGRSPLPVRSEEEQEEISRLARKAQEDPNAAKKTIISRLKNQGVVPTPPMVNGEIRRIINEDKLRMNLRHMQEAGADARYFSIDCTDRSGFAGFIKSIYQEYGRIDGVIHGAGIIRDSLIMNKDLDNFRQVIETKVIGAEVLAEKLMGDSISFLVFFSSVSGRFGNSGQADYAAANEILNKFAVKLDSQWPARVTAVNWGPWETEGMVDELVRRKFDELGISMIPGDIGVDMLMAEIHAQGQDAPEVVIFGSRKHHDTHLPLVSVVREKISRQGDLMFRLDLDAAAGHPYLRDHRIDGKMVMPAAMALEFMAEAASLSANEMIFTGIRNFHLYKGIIMDTPRKEIEITTTPLRNTPQGSSEFKVSFRAADMPQGRINYDCTVELSRTPLDIPVEPERLGKLVEYPLNVQMMYKTRLFHKGMFRRITALNGLCTDTAVMPGIKGIIRPSTPESVMSTAGHWLIDPILFDCAYQMSLVWSQEYNGTMPLPGNIAGYQQYKPPYGEKIFCEVLVQKIDTPIIHLDFLFRDDRGRLYAKARGVQVIMSRDLNRRVLTSLTRQVAASHRAGAMVA